MRATNIKWAAGAENTGLPSEMQVPCNIPKDDVGIYLSDQAGAQAGSFQISTDAHIRHRPVGLPFLHGLRMDLYRLGSPADLADVCFVLYGDARMPRIERMRSAGYPCWALFTHGENGRCEGPSDKILHALTAALSPEEP